MLFRSEEEIDDWRKQTGASRGVALTLQLVWQLSKRWYADRMAPDFRGRTMRQAQAIFRELGLTGGFWSLPIPS